MSTLTAAGWIATSGHLVLGMGDTREEALIEVSEVLGRSVEESDMDTLDGPIYTSLASAALMEQIRKEGSATYWANRDGIACTDEEYEMPD
jgi:hypothetical protein